MTAGVAAGGALRRTIGRARARHAVAAARCDLCAGAIPDAHRHMRDVQDGGLLCACPACALLFRRDFHQNTADAGRYRLVPTERTRLRGVRVDVLDVPVGLAFFVKHDGGRVLARYPSPLGVTESEVGADDWRIVEQSSPDVAAMAPLVSALLVRTSAAPGRGQLWRDQLWITPVDDCFRLVAVIRRHWTGMAGGPAVWREVARFFDELTERTR